MEALRLREQQATLSNASSEPTTALLERTAPKKIPPGVMDQGTMYRSPAAFRAGPAPAPDLTPSPTSRAAFEPIFNEDTAAAAAKPSVASSLPPVPVAAAQPSERTSVTSAPGYLDETPEVKAARAAFLEAYKAALAVQQTPASTSTTVAPAGRAATGAVAPAGRAATGAVAPAITRLSAASPSYNAYAAAGLGGASPYFPYLG
jgi:hypothetical protein